MYVQAMLPLAGKADAKAPAGLLVHTTLLTVPPPVTVGTQVALTATPAVLLVQVAVRPVNTWPGLTVVGVVKPKAADMSAAVAVTVKTAVSQMVKAVGAHTLYVTVQLPVAGTV